MRQSPATRSPSPAAIGPPAATARHSRTLERICGILAALAIWWVLFAPLWRTNFPPLPTRITLDVTFPAGISGQTEPLVTTGRTDDGDFLAVRYVDETTAVLIYDVWGMGGPTSPAFALRPGERRTLELEMPTLDHVTHLRSHEKRPLRVALDGATLLQEPVYFHRRAPAEIFFATNPIGGTIAAPHFRGQLASRDGRMWRGGPDTVFGRSVRIAWVLRSRPLPVLGSIALALAAGAAIAWLAGKRSLLRLPRLNHRSDATRFAPHPTAPHRWFLVISAMCTLAFVAVLTNGTFRMIAPDEFGDFYDFQARSFLEGRLDLPEAARNSESFIFEGRTYIYFGPTPALLRLPLTALNVAFGQLSRCFMTGYFVALLFAVYALLVHVARRASGIRSWPSRFAVVVFVSTAGMGTTLFYLASRTYVYHEAIFCGAVFAVWSGYFSLRYLAEPERPWWIGALLGGLLAVHARPPSGLFALALIGCAAVAVASRRVLFRTATSPMGIAGFVRAIRQPCLIGFLAAVCVLSFNGLSYLKFKSFEGAPLKYHIQYQDGRLAAIDGRNFHLVNFRFNFDTYMWRPDFTLGRKFPFFSIHNPPDLYYPGVKIDLFEPTLAMPYTMPALVLLALGGGALAFALWPEVRSSLAIIAVAGSIMSLALFTAVALSHRYTGDFCPPLLLAGAFGLQALELLPRFWRRIALTLTALLAALGIIVTSLITVHYQGAVVWGVPNEVKSRYENLRSSVDRLLGQSR